MVFLLHAPAPAPTPYSVVFLLHASASAPAPIKIGCGLVRCGSVWCDSSDLVGCVGEAYTPNHVLPREWAEHGLDLFKEDVEPKTLHQACWAT